MVDKVADIKGMTPEAQRKLEAAGIMTTQQFLDHTRTAAQRHALAKEVGIEPRQLTEWVNRADLMRIKGVGKEMANLLEECGVDSIKELQHRRPENLYAAMKQANDEKKIAYRAPSQA